MAKKRPASSLKSAKSGYQGQKLPADVIEGIKQMYALEGNKSLVARRFNVNLSTVYRVLGKEDPEVARENRREALGKLASKLSENALNLVEDVADIPEDATWYQKQIAMGITVDKVEKVDKRLDEKYRTDQIDAGEVMAIPEDVEVIKGMIRNDIKELAVFIGMKLGETDNVPTEDLGRIVEAEVTKLSDLDAGAEDAQWTNGDDQSNGS